MIDNGINNSYYPKRFVGKVKPPKIRRRGNLVIIDRPKERDIDIYYTVNGNNPTITDTKLVGNVINISDIDVLKIVSVQKRKFHTPVYSDIYTINNNSSPIPEQELYVPPTIGGNDNPLVDDIVNAFYVLKVDTVNRSVKLIKGGVEVAGSATVYDTLIPITEEFVEEFPELAAYIGWKLDYITIIAENLEAGNYSIEYTADELSDDSLTFEIESEFGIVMAPNEAMSIVGKNINPFFDESFGAGIITELAVESATISFDGGEFVDAVDLSSNEIPEEAVEAMPSLAPYIGKYITIIYEHSPRATGMHTCLISANGYTTEELLFEVVTTE